MDGLKRGPPNTPIAQQTKLGWILSGNIKTFNCHAITNDLSDLSRYWEVEEISSSEKDISTGDKYCEEFYQSTTKRLPNGMYEVGLPMKPDYETNLGTSKHKALGQFYQLEQKMQSNKDLSDSYISFMKEYEDMGHMTVANGKFGTTCYFPHHGILKLDSTTTRFRIVFNASSRTSTGHSLNDLMERGPNLQADLQSLIISWRQYKYVMTADIEKMFRCIKVSESYQLLQSIIWRSAPEKPLKTYQLTTVTYGTKAAPYLAMRTLKQLAQDDAQKYPKGSEALMSQYFMDDYLGGSNSMEEAKEIQTQLINILAGAGMNLRKWSSNEETLVKDLSKNQLDTPYEFRCSESRKTLGLKWNPSTDSFTFDNKFESPPLTIYTKRELLSDISRIFDPIGWISPLTIKAKLLFQETWNLKTSWDEKLPSDIIDKWSIIRKDFKNINLIIIPRHVGSQKYHIHGFSDASEKVYACSIYCVCINDKGEYTSKLLVAKTKVAPLNKTVSLPRLELCGALLLSKLLRKVINCLSNNNVEFTAWTDSMIVLGWIHGDQSRWKQFVANRVQQIKEIVPSSQWKYVKSEENPADCATRGLSVLQLSEHHLWWEGPTWLPTFKSENQPVISYEEPNIEVKKTSVNVALCTLSSTIIFELIDKSSSLTYIVRTIAWVLRYIDRLRSGPRDSSLPNALLSTELNKALNLIIKTMQVYEFKDEYDQIKKEGRVRTSSKLSCLNPFISDDGLLRVGGRLSNSNISWSAKHPIILSSHSRLTRLIIDLSHKTTLHGGAKLTLSYIRNNYWIISGMRTVKRELRRCVKCRRFSQERYQPIMADLPAARVTPSRPFTHCGIDFTGHFDIRLNKGRGVRTTKGYVAVFVCFATKATHLEVVSDLSTPAFLAAFRRMCSRRGTPSDMYSDNGTNFIGASKLLREEHIISKQTINDDFINYASEQGVTWHFNAPSWPSAGGLWESAVRIMKLHLKKVIGEQKLTYEEFLTLLTQIEACMNSRPLCALTENVEDLEPLTPGHFLVGGPLISSPQSDCQNITLPVRWQLVQSMIRGFWRKWSQGYLQSLQQRDKWRTQKQDIKIADIVLVKDELLPPTRWAMGKVIKLHPGEDGQVRVVTIKTKINNIKRPVTKLIPLLPNDSVNQTTATSTKTAAATQQRHGRTAGGSPSVIKSFFLLLVLMFTLLSPSVQRQTGFNITKLENNQSLYFDKISNLRFIRDDWKLIIYYNMSSYWQAVYDIEKYVSHIKESGSLRNDSPYKSLVLQLEHELTEIRQYNQILKYNRKRKRRGLINGIGNAANYLFGVLDDRFAQQYEEQIELTRNNENHLQNLIHNQTLIIEAEYNILRKHEDIMKKQFTSIKDHINNLTLEVGHIRADTSSSIYLTTSSLAAHIILSSIRHMQQTLVDAVTDIHRGYVNTHLLSPQQLRDQINVISAHLPGDLTLPVDGLNVMHLYKLLRVLARVTDRYLIIEIRIPLLSNDNFELDKMIAIPQKRQQNYNYIIPTFPYIGFNINKDAVLFLTDHDLQLCQQMTEGLLLCALDSPVYTTNIKQSICDIQLISRSTSLSPCSSEITTCKESWLKLNADNVWLYSCCDECRVRVICLSEITSQVLNNNGIIHLGPMCTIKGLDFDIYSHNNYLNVVRENVVIPSPVTETSVLNKLINTSMMIKDAELDSAESMWDSIKSQISELKQQSRGDLNYHDVHHYSLGYIIVGMLVLAAGVLMFRRVRARYTSLRGAGAAAPAPTTSPEEAPPAPAPRTNQVIVNVPGELCESDSVVRKSDSVISMDKATSPMFNRTVKFDVE